VVVSPRSPPLKFLPTLLVSRRAAPSCRSELLLCRPSRRWRRPLPAHHGRLNPALRRMMKAAGPCSWTTAWGPPCRPRLVVVFQTAAGSPACAPTPRRAAPLHHAAPNEHSVGWYARRRSAGPSPAHASPVSAATASARSKGRAGLRRRLRLSHGSVWIGRQEEELWG
jgi:hypothetical protein